MKYIATINETEYIIELDQDPNTIVVNDETYKIDFHQLPEGSLVSLLINNRSLEGVVEEQDTAWDVLIQGELYTVHVQDERAHRLAQARGVLGASTGEAHIKSPMPGIIVAVPVQVGDMVEKGDKVIILESMKMENELRSPRDGIVTQVSVAQGDGVEKDQLLVVISDPDIDKSPELDNE